MSRQYIFKVIERNVKWLKNSRTNIATLEGDILIQIIETEYNLPDCFFNLKVDKIRNNFFVKDVTFKGNENIQEHEVTGYLKGYFGFSSQESIERSLLNLQEIINENKSLPEQLDVKWNIFVEQFSEWFKKKLKPCLQKELELYEMYWYTDNSMDVN